MSLSNFCCTLLKFYSQSFSGAICFTSVDWLPSLYQRSWAGASGSVPPATGWGTTLTPAAAGHVRRGPCWNIWGLPEAVPLCFIEGGPGV